MFGTMADKVIELLQRLVAGVRIIWFPPWLFPPPQAEPFNYAVWIIIPPADAANHDVISFIVPPNRNGVIRWIGNGIEGGGWQQGSAGAGGLRFQILADGTPYKNHANILSS